MRNCVVVRDDVKRIMKEAVAATTWGCMSSASIKGPVIVPPPIPKQPLPKPAAVHSSGYLFAPLN
jgi:hypothetical protein